MPSVHLARGRVQPVWAGHPWVYAQAIDHVEGAPAPGDVVDVLDPEGRHHGRGYWSPRSAIPVRIATRDKNDPLDGPSIGRKIEAARAMRRKFGLPSVETTGYRLVHAEGDGLPGLIVDVLGDTAVVQLLSIGMKRREDDVFAHVARVAEVETVIEVGSEKVAAIEGYVAETRVVRGPEKATIDLLPMQPGDVRSTMADVRELEQAVGFRPDTSVQEGIARFVEWYRGYYGE
jgi:23S rRNA (cytosine1962-C5)-methyltransferase